MSTEPKRCNKMYKHDSPLLPYKMAIQNHNEDHTTEFKIKFRNLEKISLNYSGSKAHRQFNITRINNKFLPIHSHLNMYIYIYIYILNIYIYIYIYHNEEFLHQKLKILLEFSLFK